ncbi:MAG: TlpA family protein disulfide reductase [bacterium]|nr:TlpA family protein disulfide reductase [bacterium]
MTFMRPLFLCVALAAAALLADRAAGVAAAPPHRDAPAPAFTLPLADGAGSLSLASLKGHPVYLNYFASWCPPCNAEAPSLSKLAVRYAKKGLVVVGIDELESAKQALGFKNKYHLPYRVVLDADGSVGAAYGVYALPVHVFIRRDGKVASYHPGEMDAAQIGAELAKITE